MPRASTAINIVQRVGGSIGTALVAVVLTHQIDSQVHGQTGGLSAVSTISAAARVRIQQPLATAFGHTFWWPLGLTVLGLVPAVLLPRVRAGDGTLATAEEGLLVE